MNPVSTRGFVSPVLSWSEKAFQSQVVDAAKALGWLVYHTHDSRRSEPGFPDLVLVHETRKQILYRELKTQTGRTSPDQKKWLGVLSAVGSDAGVWRPEDWLSLRIQSELAGGSGA